MDPDGCCKILIQRPAKQGFLFKRRCSKIDRSKSYHIAGKVFSVFSEYNFTRPAALEDLTERLNEPIVNI